MTGLSQSSNPHHVAFTHDMFEGAKEWQERYASGLRHCNRGISGLRTSEINPYHPAIKDRSTQPLSMVAYQITNNITGHVSWWFESEYEAAFAEYRKQLDTNPHEEYRMFLAAAVIPKTGTAERSWKDFFDNGDHDDHNHTMYWKEKYNSWMF
jgi:hypothetical protein